MTPSSSARLRLSSPRRRLHVQLCELHRGLPLAHVQKINNADVEDSGEVVKHSERRIPTALLKLLDVPVRDAFGSDILLRHSQPPACSLKIPAKPGEHRAEVHGTNVVRGRTRIEPTELARLWFTNFDPGRTLIVASA